MSKQSSIQKPNNIVSEAEEKGKVLAFDDNPSRFFALTDEAAEREDLLAALSFALAGYRKKPSLDALSDIGDIYADRGLYELSNRYWYKYMNKAGKEDVSTAYEELAINFFYMNNFALSGYYFHLKLTQDGFVNREGLDEDIINFFDGITNERELYRIVYPEKDEDCSVLIKDGKRALAASDFKSAEKFLKAVPSTSRDYKEAITLLAMGYFIAGNDEEAIKTNREILDFFGDDATAYANLSEIYRIKEDNDKATYFYEKALNSNPSSEESYIKIASCAVYAKDDKKAAEFFEKALDEKIFDKNVLSLYGAALVNSGNYKKGAEIYSKIYRIDPDDTVLAFYARVSERLASGGGGEEYLPFDYSDNLPEKERSRRERKIKSVLSGGKEKISVALKDKEFSELLRWGMTCASDAVAENCIRIYSADGSKQSVDTLESFLIDESTDERVKEAILFSLVILGVKSKIGISVNGFYLKVKVGRPLCEKDPFGAVYLAAYALAFSRLAALGADFADKILAASDKVYYKTRKTSLPLDFGREEIAALTVSVAGLPFIKKEKDVCGLFGIKAERLADMLKIYGENGYDKNNRRG